jgi:hypothetical protein
VPITAAAQSGTNPAQGVIVANPAMEPVSKPTNFGFLSLDHSIITQATVANEAATSLFKKAMAVIPSTVALLPALKPYQPNHKSPLPMATSGMLFGVEFLSALAPT